MKKLFLLMLFISPTFYIIGMDSPTKTRKKKQEELKAFNDLLKDTQAPKKSTPQNIPSGDDDKIVPEVEMVMQVTQSPLDHATSNNPSTDTITFLKTPIEKLEKRISCLTKVTSAIGGLIAVYVVFQLTLFMQLYLNDCLS
jgi:hypothetical protein